MVPLAHPLECEQTQVWPGPSTGLLEGTETLGSGGGFVSEHLDLSHGGEGILQARERRPCRTKLG